MAFKSCRPTRITLLDTKILFYIKMYSNFPFCTKKIKNEIGTYLMFVSNQIEYMFLLWGFCTDENPEQHVTCPLDYIHFWEPLDNVWYRESLENLWYSEENVTHVKNHSSKKTLTVATEPIPLLSGVLPIEEKNHKYRTVFCQELCLFVIWINQ